MEWYLEETPGAFPQACVFCTSHKGPVVHARRDLPGYGWVYVCVKCANGIATKLGYVPGEHAEALLNEAASLRHALQDAERQVEEAHANRLQVVALDDVRALVAKPNPKAAA